MNRLGRQSRQAGPSPGSWSLMAFVLLTAALAACTPIAWWHARLPKARAVRKPLAPQAEYRPAPRRTIEPQVAPLKPLVAEQIDLDPSITAGPPLPATDSPRVNQELMGEASGALRLGPEIVASRQPLPYDTALQDVPLRQPEEPLEPSGPAFGEDGFPLTKAWPYPAGLVEQLNILSATTPAAKDWAAQVTGEIDRLVLAPTLANASVASPLANLHRLAGEGKQRALALDDENARASWLRAGYAIVRRLVIWDMVHALSAASQRQIAAPIIDKGLWSRTLGNIDIMLADTGVAGNWRKYLLINRAREEFDAPDVLVEHQRLLARDMLYRLNSTQLSHDQQEFLKLPPFQLLEKQLIARAAMTPDYIGLLKAIEHYEHVDRSSNAQELARRYDMLRWQADPAVQELAEVVNAYYRNANIRVALSEQLVNRMLPKTQSQVEPVQDVILGATVEGQSHTSTRLRLVLLPDRRRWNIGLEANGQVASTTASSKGPATFYQDGFSLFRARKRLTVDRRGIRIFSAEAAANADSHLNDFETDFDGIPLLGGVVRAVARSQYDESQDEAKLEVESRIVDRATSQLDREVAQKLENAKRDLQAKLVDPLHKLELEPTAVDLETTADRLIARYRLAARDQLSAHTPRPQAPGDSLLSVQIHETAFNNILQQLDLAGRTFKLEELYTDMISRFSQEPVEIPEDLPENVHVTFADEDPVRVDAQDGRVRLTIRLAELSQGTRHQWNDFTVRGYYAPTADQLDANLVREGIIELIGDKGAIRLSDQIALRGIFSKVLSRNRKLNLVNKQIGQAPELADQQVTQFVVHDGWIGVALGPKTPGREVHMQPKADIAGGDREEADSEE